MQVGIVSQVRGRRALWRSIFAASPPTQARDAARSCEVGYSSRHCEAQSD
jgi:hypothetical protein